jgi:excisionase family DNA binding protein
MGQQMMAAMGAQQATPAAARGAVPPFRRGWIPDLLGTSDVAKALGVSEADCARYAGKGELKGKKIGSTWRVTRAALDEFLKISSSYSGNQDWPRHSPQVP